MRNTTVWTRHHTAVNWTAIVSTHSERQRLPYTAGAHEGGFDGIHWSHLADTLAEAQALADAAVPPHNCDACQAWAPLTPLD